MRTGRPKGRTGSFNRATIATMGQRFGELVAVSPTRDVQHSHRLWLFRCDCGNEVHRRLSRVRDELKAGRTPACLDCGDGYLACINCNKRGHTMLTCPQPFDPSKQCPQCADLAWRRPERRPCFCGRAHRAEAAPARGSNGIGGQPWL
jgi:hypothetical protein